MPLDWLIWIVAYLLKRQPIIVRLYLWIQRLLAITGISARHHANLGLGSLQFSGSSPFLQTIPREVPLGSMIAWHRLLIAK